MKKILIASMILVVFGSCTKDFEATNQNPNQISDLLLKQDFNLVGSPFSGMLFQLHGDAGSQTNEDLCYDSWMGYMNATNPFTGNINNTTYYVRWNSYWGREYNNIMAPAKQVIQLAKDNNLPLFATWAKFIRILSMSRLTAIHGPIIYSNYGSTAAQINYDKESDLYNTFFLQLDSIQNDFAANKTYAGFKNFDPSYKGDIPSWLRLINSVRLQLAMRISKVDPATAKIQGEKALGDANGLISTNAQNFLLSLNGNPMPVSVICFSWGDTRVGAPLESFMVGLKDGRISKYFQPAASAALYADHPSSPYKGIRNGAFINAKNDYLDFSTVSNDFLTAQTRRELTASQVYFLKAEAALRGWANAGDAKTNYETGVKLSFADWGASGVDAYLADATSTPSSYVDAKNALNNFTSLSSITVAWNDADTKEVKLEKIITQKYIAGFTNSLDAWVDFRRTGYPKIPHVAKNDSDATNGIITADQWVKRWPFITAERTGNAAAVADAVSKMGAGAKDDIATRLWWDTGSATNF